MLRFETPHFQTETRYTIASMLCKTEEILDYPLTQTNLFTYDSHSGQAGVVFFPGICARFTVVCQFVFNASEA